MEEDCKTVAEECKNGGCHVWSHDDTKRLRKRWDNGNINLHSPLFSREISSGGNDDKKMKRGRLHDESRVETDMGTIFNVLPGTNAALISPTHSLPLSLFHTHTHTHKHTQTLIYVYMFICIYLIANPKGAEQLLGRIKKMKMSDQSLANSWQERLPPGESAEGKPKIHAKCQI